MTEKNTEDIVDGEVIEDEVDAAEQQRSLIEGADLKDDTSEYLDALAEERTVIFVSDSRTSPLLLAETVSMLIAEKRISRGVVDVQSPAGRTIAAQFQRAGIAYDVIAYGKRIEQPGPGPHPKPEYHEVPGEEHIPFLLQQAAGITLIEPHNIAHMDMNIVLLPAMSGTGQIRIDLLAEGANSRDLSMNTIPGIVLAACEKAKRELLFIDTPEYGLVLEANGDQHRRIVHVFPETPSEDSEDED